MAILPGESYAALLGQVDDGVLVDQFLILESRLNLQKAVFDENVLIRIRRLREVAIAGNH